MPSKRESSSGSLQKILCFGMPSLLLGLNLLIFGTFTVYNNNPGEFLVAYTDSLQLYYLPALLIFLALALVGMLLGSRAGRIFNAVIILFASLSYVHGNLLLWDTGVLDGSALDLSKNWRSMIDAVLWIAFGWIAFRFRHWLVDHGWKICVTLILFQAIGVVVSLGNEQSASKSNTFVLPAELTRFSEQKNLIHIVLDGFQASIFEQIISEHPEMVDDFSGFTFFRDATTSSAVTYLSIPATLTGKAFINQQNISEYLEQTLGGKNLYSFLADNGFQVDVATPLWWNQPSAIFSSYYRIPTPYTDEHATLLSTTLLLADISLYRQVPHFVKSLVYDSGTWLMSGTLVDQPEQQFSHFAHSAFFVDLQNKMTVVPSVPKYKFIHLVTPHAPLVSTSECGFTGKQMDYGTGASKNQSFCILKQLVGFLQKLKAMGIYDNSMLIIHGDHGGGVAFSMYRDDGSETNSAEALHRMWGNPLPLVLVKPLGKKGALQTSNELVQLLDIPATVTEQLGLASVFPGRSMFVTARGAEPVRFYYRSTMHRNDAAAKDHFDNFSTFKVTGSIYAVDSWHEVGTYVAPVTDDEDKYVWGTSLSFGNRGTFQPFQAGGWVVTRSKDVTWTEGHVAGLSISFSEINGPVRMLAKVKPLLVAGKLNQQQVGIIIGGRRAGEWMLNDDRFQDVELIIPPELFSATGNTDIQFELPDAHSPASLDSGKDQRVLALAFMSIKFERLEQHRAQN